MYVELQGSFAQHLPDVHFKIFTLKLFIYFFVGKELQVKTAKIISFHLSNNQKQFQPYTNKLNQPCRVLSRSRHSPPVSIGR